MQGRDGALPQDRRSSVSSGFSFPPSPKRSLSLADDVDSTAWKRFLQHLSAGAGPVLVLLRHCQAESNEGATRNGVRIRTADRLYTRDAPLSDQGKIQASKLRNEYPSLIENVKGAGGKILISHLLRAKQTGFYGFPELLGKCRDLVEIRPELQETASWPSSTGKTPEAQAAEFPGFDYSRCGPEENMKKTGIYSSKDRTVHIRANAVLKKLKIRPEPLLVLITHAGFACELVDDYSPPLGTGKGLVYAFRDNTTKLHPVSPDHAARILGQPRTDSK